MSVAPDGVIYMARLLAVLLVLGLASPVAARFRVCTLAFNGPEEVDVFRERLPPQDFEIVDLSAALATPAPAADAPASWPAGLCPADLRCDVVVFSAEFGGRFFGRSGGSLSLQSLEEASCQPRCAGLFHVPQEVFLFSGTVEDNLRLAGDGAAERPVIERALEAANAERFVAALPNGLGEELRERGVNLSQGQRQLLAIARAIIYNPRVLALDEATSSIDPESEALVRVGLARLLEGRTSLVIAHRLSTIQRADRILVLHRGEIREAGAHAELLAQGGLYSRLYELQFGLGRT